MDEKPLPRQTISQELEVGVVGLECILASFHVDLYWKIGERIWLQVLL